jgi:DNA mismatch repair protein MutL
MNKIIILPENVSSKIAAGEVIERPSSVIRELIDNSIDSGSSEITIKTIDAGIEKIIVSDNGNGISKEDLPLVFAKHATSKIHDIDDLLKLTTMGFRGEALHSIQTVSKISIISQTDSSGKTSGFKISNFGDQEFKVIPVTSKKGTKAEVEDLFYNLPARKKFLKSKTTELNSIKKVIADKALTNLGIAINYYNDNKLIFSTKGKNNFSDSFFSINKSENSFEIYEYHEEISKYLKIKIHHSSSDQFFQNRKYQFLFVNNRPVSASFFFPALDIGYRNFISPGRYPLYFVYIDIDPAMIDVNIHPAKKEIKFHNQNEIFTAIQNTVSKSQSHIFKREILETPISFDTKNYDKYSDNLMIETRNFSPVSYKSSENFDNFKITDKAEYQILGVVFDTYIIVEIPDKVLLIDQHAAAEAIIYRRKKEKYENNLNTEQLLIPAVIEINWNNDTEKKIDILNKNNFTIDINEGSAITVREVPEILLLKKDYSIACEIITDYIENKESTNVNIVEYILIESSCKEAIKKGDKINMLEMAEIVNEYFKYNITNCPHGRPSHFEISRDSLEKIFQRKK